MNAFTLIIRPEYLEICEGDHCAAAILDLFKRWSASKLRWIYKSQPELYGDLMGLFGLNRVGAALLKLREWGYLKHRQNPKNRQDKTLQYQVNGEVISEALTLLSGASDIENDGLEPTKDGSETLILKSRTPGLSDEESIKQSLITSESPSDESSSSPTRRPDDDDLVIFKPYEKRFGSMQPYSEALREYVVLMRAASIIEVMERCAVSNGRAWPYVVAALANAAPNVPETRDYRNFEGSDKAKWQDDTPAPAQDSKPPSAPPVVSPDAETQPDMEDATPAPDSREMEAWRYLEICIGKPEFDTYLRGSKVQVDGATWTIRPVNGYAERMLQDHRFLNAIRRGLADVLIVAPEALNIQIERKAVAA